MTSIIMRVEAVWALNTSIIIQIFKCQHIMDSNQVAMFGNINYVFLVDFFNIDNPIKCITSGLNFVWIYIYLLEIE